jgi:hypothetical protein
MVWHDHHVDVVVQRISTWWTKESRGAPAATARNSAPIAFPLPAGFASGLHDVVMREATGFEPDACTADLSEPDLDLGLSVQALGGTLHIRPPERYPGSVVIRSRRPPAVNLQAGQWLRWQINHCMIAWSGGLSHYMLQTFNVYGGPPPDPEIFFTVPSRQVDERSRLR